MGGGGEGGRETDRQTDGDRDRGLETERLIAVHLVDE